MEDLTYYQNASNSFVVRDSDGKKVFSVVVGEDSFNEEQFQKITAMFSAVDISEEVDDS